MSRAILTEDMRKKWEPILEHKDFDKIQGDYKEAVTTILLENTSRALQESTNISGGLGDGTNIATYQPVLISLLRRAAPKLIAFDVGSVQPMSGPSGLVFYMKSRYHEGNSSQALTDDPEALFNEANTAWSGAGSAGSVGGKTPVPADVEVDPSKLIADSTAYKTGKGMTTSQAEALGTSTNYWNEMGFTIEKISVIAQSRALKASYTSELQQDLQAIHGLNAENELANILSAEIVAEINREFVRNIYKIAMVGAANTTSPGTFNMDVDANGRWLNEKFKGLMYQLERESNAIAKTTRRGRGNFLIVSPDIASALAMAGSLDMNKLDTNLDQDTATTTFAGTLNGRFKVYIDPYLAGNDNEFAVVGYRGSNPYDAGVFYCPYVPLEMYKSIGQDDFQPRIGFKTRYGMATNPFGNTAGNNAGEFISGVHTYFRKIKISNIM